MAKSSESRSNGAVLPLKASFARPISSSPSDPPFSPFPASSSATSSTASPVFRRSSSPRRVSLRHSSPPPPTSVRFSLDRSLSPSRSVSFRDQEAPRRKEVPKKNSCMCSPTSHPGSFRCNYHRSLSNRSQKQSISWSPSRLNLRRSAMTNSLVRIGTVEGDWVKRALSALIRPTSHHQRRRTDFVPRPSRLSAMSKAEDSAGAVGPIQVG